MKIYESRNFVRRPTTSNELRESENEVEGAQKGRRGPGHGNIFKIPPVVGKLSTVKDTLLSS